MRKPIELFALAALVISLTGVAAPNSIPAASLEQKVGSLLLPRISGTFLADEDPEFQALTHLVREGKVGGAVFFAGDPLSVASTIERLRAAAPERDLLFGLDAEWGIAMRLEGATHWPRAMALGAADDPDLAREMGRVTALEARALGIDLVLAPVADLALRADNAVIGNRSFGADPQRVGRLVAAFVEGVQSTGALAVVKHFPGHGATSDDSHYTLPVLDLEPEVLRQRELVPFRAAIEAGVAAVMPGHLALPRIDPSGAPASLSPILLQEWLRKELAFDGLVVSDALDMQGAKTLTWDGRVSAQALAAGVDLLLLPTHPDAAHAEILRAVARGDLEASRVEDAYQRVRLVKEALQTSSMKSDSPASHLSRPEFTQATQRTARLAITAFDPQGVLPLESWSPPKVTLVELDHHPERRNLLPLRRALAARTQLDWIRVPPLPPGATYASNETAHLRGPLAAFEARLLAADVVLIALQHGGARWCADRQCTRLDESRASLVADLQSLVASEKQVIVTSFADPWPLYSEDFDSFPRLAAHDGSEASQRAVAAALLGEFVIGGVPPLWPVAEKIAQRVAPHPTHPLRHTSPEEEGMSGHALRKAAQLLERATRDGTTPSAVALVARRGAVVFEEAFGRLADRDHLPPEWAASRRNAPRAGTDTLYDLASLTKVVATTTLAMRLVEQRRLELDRPIVDYLPEFLAATEDAVQREWKQRITPRHLLTHTSGVLWWTDLHQRHGVYEGETPAEAWQSYLEEIYSLPLESEPGTTVAYSDLGMMLLAEILQRVGGAPYAQLVRQEVLEPLDMSETSFAPESTLRDRTAPTEFDAWRDRVVWAEVHDENAAGLGGLAPHAGLFSTIGDLAKFAQMILSGGIHAGERYLNGRTIDLFTTRDPALTEDATRALGWDTPSARSSAGQLFSARAFGHTGFTGTSIWIDPEHDLFVILLTNRVHPTREEIRIRDLRPAFHEAVTRSITDQEIRERPGSLPR